MVRVIKKDNTKEVFNIQKYPGTYRLEYLWYAAVEKPSG